MIEFAKLIPLIAKDPPGIVRTGATKTLPKLKEDLVVKSPATASSLTSKKLPPKPRPVTSNNNNKDLPDLLESNKSGRHQYERSL